MVPKPGEVGVGSAGHPYVDDIVPRYVRAVPEYRSVNQATAAPAPSSAGDFHAVCQLAVRMAEDAPSSSGLWFRGDKMRFADDPRYHFRDHKVRHTVDYRNANRPSRAQRRAEGPEADWGNVDWHRYVGGPRGSEGSGDITAKRRRCGLRGSGAVATVHDGPADRTDPECGAGAPSPSRQRRKAVLVARVDLSRVEVKGGSGATRLLKTTGFENYGFAVGKIAPRIF